MSTASKAPAKPKSICVSPLFIVSDTYTNIAVLGGIITEDIKQAYALENLRNMG